MSGGDRQVFDCGCVFWSDAQAGERCDVCPACCETRAPTLDADPEWRKSQEVSAATIRRGAALRRRKRHTGLRALLRNAWSDLLGALGYGLTRKERRALEARLARRERKAPVGHSDTPWRWEYRRRAAGVIGAAMLDGHNGLDVASPATDAARIALDAHVRWLEAENERLRQALLRNTDNDLLQ